MFEKASWRIKRFISPRNNKEVQENEDVKQKRQLKPKSWRSQDRKSMDEAFLRRTNSNAAGQISSPPLPSPLSTQYSLRSACECGCNSPIRSPPHSLSKFDSRSGTLQDLCLGPEDSSRFILVSRSSSAIPFLPPNTSANTLYQTASTSQLDLLEALALEPVKNANETLYQEPLTMCTPKSGDISKDIQHLIRETNHAFKTFESTLTTTMATSQELHSTQDETNPIAKKMSPRIEPRRRYRTQTPPTVIVSQSESTFSQSFGKNQQFDKHRQYREHHIRGFDAMGKPLALSKSLPILDGMREGSLVTSSRDSFPRSMVNRRAEPDTFTHLSVESLGENSLRPSSETSRSTASGSTASTPLEPFHLQDLPLRIRLAEGLIAERPPGMQRVEIRQSTASTLTIQNSIPTRQFNSFPFNMELRNGQYTRVSKREVVLKSTNFSLTSLGYKHGDIRVQQRPRPSTKSKTIPTARSSLPISHTTNYEAESSTSRTKDGSELQDGELDLPGFQTAISGAWMKECEVCLTGGPHPRSDEFEAEVDEIVKWCNDFGLDMGRLVKGHLPREKQLRNLELQKGRRLRRQLNLEASAEKALSVVGSLEIGRHLRVGSGGSSDTLFGPPLYETIKVEGAREAKGEKNEKVEGNHDDETSLPPSPMQSIDPSALARPESFVPMGYNIDHDLSDYLKWKSECVHSTAKGDI